MSTIAELRSLDVVLTSRCNLACGYCFENDKKPGRMEWDTLRAGLDLLLASRRDEVRVVFFGGEPLLEFPLLRRAVTYVEEVRPPERQVGYSIVTNGTLIDDERLAFLAAHRFRTQLSFDGVEAAQEQRGHGTFEVLDALLGRMASEHPDYLRTSVRVSLTLVPATIPFLADSIEYFIGKGVKEIALAPSSTAVSGWKDELRGELDQQFRRIFRASLRHYRKTFEVPLVLLRRGTGKALPRKAKLSMCGVDRGETLTLDVDGEVTGCVTFAGSYQKFRTRFLRERLEAMRMGDVRSPELPRRLQLYPEAARGAGLFNDKQDKYSSYGRCGECRHLMSCTVCPISIGHLPGNTDPRRVPDFLCAFQLSALACRERFPRQSIGRWIESRMRETRRKLGPFAAAMP